MVRCGGGGNGCWEGKAEDTIFACLGCESDYVLQSNRVQNCEGGTPSLQPAGCRRYNAPPKQNRLGRGTRILYGKYDGLTPIPMMKIRSVGESTMNEVATSPPG